MLLGEKVFGPVLFEFEKTIDTYIWTRKEFKAAQKLNNEVWRRVSAASVSVYGTPDAAIELSQSGIS
jgi:hypothetical protein